MSSAVDAAKQSRCPFHTQKTVSSVEATWWPNKLDMKGLPKTQHATANDIASYKEKFLKLDLAAVKSDINGIMTTSQKWWPADYGHYGPFFVRMAWHAAGTYRTFDGRGGSGTGNLRFAPLNSWPDNGNLDKARRLLWPIKKKYGESLSWGDLMILTGNVAIESMGLETFGFAGGRVDIWEPEADVYWGPEKKWLAAERGGLGDKLDQPLGAVQMGLIYVNPEGPGGMPDPLMAAHDIRTTFGRMAMNDEETVALIAGGHTFGKAHGAADPGAHVGPEPEGARIHEQGFGWTSTYKSGVGADAITSGLEGAWTDNPTKWDNGYFDTLFKYEWEQTKSPAGATQWIPTDKEVKSVPDAHLEGVSHAPIMFTTDLALKMDPAYLEVSTRFHQNPEEFAMAFKKAWYKLCHRDLGPVSRCLGSEVPSAQLWQDPVPAFDSSTAIEDADVAELKAACLEKCSVASLVKTAWASASSYRATDHRGGANGARIRLEPQISWKVNDPDDLIAVLASLTEVQNAFNEKGAKKVSMADLIVLAGNGAVEAAAKAAGNDVSVPFTPGRTDASIEETDVESFSVLEPTSDGFRNFLGVSQPNSPQDMGATAEALLVDRAHMLGLSKGEMSVLVGGMRTIGANAGGSTIGVLTSNVGQLSNDFFVNLCDMSTAWKPSAEDEQLFTGTDRDTGAEKWKATRVDLIFGSNSELRAIAEFYASDDCKGKFVDDFVLAWNKVMMNDRFDVK
ncbi:hypothetical protein TrST_g12254 [Triparma strigata]|uniref:Catalase-peroxidase n=1 Tax=Triparma strigata TaxID=1606541 RepID=A0A9W7EQA8_9STRA|nr:hypothetical protein TrST_g12254 [Triparma strigata]